MNTEEAPYEKLDESSYYNKSQKSTVPLQKDAAQAHGLSERRKVVLKFIIFLICTIFIVIGRFSVPDNEPKCVVDKVQDMLEPVNNYVLLHNGLRNALQIMCSGFMDILFLSTGAYWILYNKSSNLILTVLTFYVVRAGIQAIWESPFPHGFWWYNPGFPSLVVPYGRGSDFFFSGHIGFVTICTTQWIRNKKPWMIAFCVIGGIYTAFILLSYQVHYSIDIFTGIIFAHWSYIMIESYKDPIDNFFLSVYVKGRKVCLGLGKKIKDQEPLKSP